MPTRRPTVTRRPSAARLLLRRSTRWPRLLLVALVLCFGARVDAYSTHGETTRDGEPTNLTLAQVFESIRVWLERPDPARSTADDLGIGAHIWLTYKAVRLLEAKYGVTLPPADVRQILEGAVEEDFAVAGTQDSDYLFFVAEHDSLLPSPVSFGTCLASAAFCLQAPLLCDLVPTETCFGALLYSRAENHFMSPPTWSELTDGSWLLLAPGPAAVWATTDLRNEYQYQAALEAYPADRARAFRALGHALHVLEDMTVPAHVRNDAHVINSDNYESALSELTPGGLESLLSSCGEGTYDSCEPIVPAAAQSATAFAKATAVQPLYQDVATFSASNFFSDDTIFETEHAGVVLVGPDPTHVSEQDGYFWNANPALPGPVRIAHDPSLPLVPHDIDDAVVYDAFAVLGPRAIRAGAGLLYRFLVDTSGGCSGDGSYCGSALGLSAERLYVCQDGRYLEVALCEGGCERWQPAANDRCAPQPPTVVVTPDPGDVGQCVAQGGTGFPPNTTVTLVFEDRDANTTSRNPVTTDPDGTYDWYFGLGCGGLDALPAYDRATAFLDRVDPGRVGFSGRSMRYWTEYWDGGLRRSNVVDYSLDYAGECQRSCGGRECGDDGCGGSCGSCGPGEVCADGLCAQAAPRLTVCGEITSDTRWTTADSPVLVTCDLVVRRELVIDAGVAVFVQHAADDIRLEGSYGELVANGTAAAPVVFAPSADNPAQSWGGFVVNAWRRLELHGTEIRAAGNLASDARYPIRQDLRGTVVTSDVRLVGNRIDAISAVPGTYADSISFSAVGVPYLLEADVTLDRYDRTLTLRPGVIVKSAGAGTDIRINYGRLNAVGSGSLPIILTSASDDERFGDTNADGAGSTPAPGDWGGIWFGGGASDDSTLDHVIVNYGGAVASSGGGFPVRVDPQSRPAMRNLVLRDNLHDAIAVTTGRYTSSIGLDVVGVPYWVEGDLVLDYYNATFTIAPGVVVKMAGEGTDIQIWDGTLDADGTAAAPIVFTSAYDDTRGGDANADGAATAPSAGDWGGIRFESGADPDCALDHVVVNYGGAATSDAAGFPLRVDPRTHPSMTNMTLAHNVREAIGVDTGTYTSSIGMNVVGVPYWVSADVVLDYYNATFTIQPGVVVKLDGTGTDVRIVDGTLRAVGSAEQPIVFTSARDDTRLGDSNVDGTASRPAAGDWGGVRFHYSADSDSALRHVVLEYGGSPVSAGAGFPLRVDLRSQPSMTDMALSHNVQEAIGVDSGTYTSSIGMNVVGVPYWVSADVVLDYYNATFTIQPGVVVKLSNPDTDVRIVDGTLRAVGSADQPIVFTSARDDTRLGDSNEDGSASVPAAGDWGGIRFHYSADSDSALRHVVLEYGGSPDSAGSGFPLRVDLRTQPSMTDVALAHNVQEAIGVDSGTYTSSIGMNVVGVPYWVSADVALDYYSATFTIQPGVVVKLSNPDTDVWILDGTLRALGSADQPIVFTSARNDTRLGDSNEDGTASSPAPGDWGGIRFEYSADPDCALDHVIIEYGGSATSDTNGFPLRVDPRTQPAMTNMALADNVREAIRVDTGTYTSSIGLNVVGVPYWVGADLALDYYSASFTIQPGVVVKLTSPDTDVWVLDGTLRALGTADRPIVFTSARDDTRLGDSNEDGTASSPAPGDWGGIRFEYSADPDCALDHVVIEYGGSATSDTNGFPLRVDPRTQPAMSNLGLAHNVREAIRVDTGTYTSSIGLNVVGVPYRVGADLALDYYSASFVIRPGVVVKLDGEGTDLVVHDGAFSAEGTAALPIVFTSGRDDARGGDSNADGDATIPAAGDWGGIELRYSADDPVVRNAIIAYGGSNAATAICGVDIEARDVLLENVTFEENHDAVCLWGNGTVDLGGGALGSVGGNRFLGHVGGLNAWSVHNGTSRTVYALDNYWDTALPSEIDATIRDRKDDASLGEVIYAPFIGCVAGLVCSDGDPCTRDDTCVDGVCSGTTYTCRAPGPCELTGVCTGDGTCRFDTAVGRACDDGEPCTADDRCDADGACVGVAFRCDAPGPCETADGATCDGNGTCTYPVAVAAPCDDGDACTHTDRCQADRSCSGTLYACDTPGGCETANGATCDGDGGCLYPPDTGAPCDDGDACTSGDACGPDRSCEGTPYACDSPGVCEQADGATCDGDGTCTYLAAAGAACDDGDDCTYDDRCDGARACAGTAYTCDDPGACETSIGATCDGDGGCVYVPDVGAACDDDDPCTADDRCDESRTCRGSSYDCDSPASCETAVGARCNGDGSCTYPALFGESCDDGDPCTRDDRCDEAAACAGESYTCDAPGVCETSVGASCNGDGTCTYPVTPGAPCDDEDACTEGDACVGSACRGTDVSCDDGNPCTEDVCEPVTGCVQRPAEGPCDDGDPCTEDDQCRDGSCVPGEPVVCDDDNPCTEDSCVPGDGCSSATLPDGAACDDEDPCTRDDACADALCVGTPSPETCPCAVDDDCAPFDDDDVCNGRHTCDVAESVCRIAPASVPQCDDGDACNGTETCDPVDGCIPGTPLVCDDGDACNGTETCDAANGCVSGTPLVCDDGDACNGTETCDAADGCVPGTPLGCDDGDACNGTETCDPVDGCVPGTPLVCDDGDACNGTESCVPADGCVAGAPVTCDDGDACNGTETCDPADGCVTGTPLDCDDGDACNGVETCDRADGCRAGTPLACDDGDPCTADECEPTSGCAHTSLDGCCYQDEDCGAGGEFCLVEEHRCVAGVCASCETDDDCGGDGDLCVALASGLWCGRDCSDGQSCPDGSICTDLDDGSRQCLPGAGDCRCVADAYDACHDGDVVAYSSCGEPGAVVTSCDGRGCVADACCVPGTHREGDECVADAAEGSSSERVDAAAAEDGGPDTKQADVERRDAPHGDAPRDGIEMPDGSSAPADGGRDASGDGSASSGCATAGEHGTTPAPLALLLLLAALALWRGALVVLPKPAPDPKR